MTRVPHLALLAALALAGAGCAAGTSRSATTGAGQPAAASVSPAPQQLTDLRDIGQLRTLFNGASGEPRLIILVSPT